MVFKYLCHGQESKVLEVLIRVLNEQPQLGDAELYGGRVVGDTHYHRGDALVEQRHGRGTVDEVCQRLYQLLSKAGLQGCESTKLKDGREGGREREDRLHTDNNVSPKC